MNKGINLVRDICESEVYVSNNEQYVVIPKSLADAVITEVRRKIIDLLREQNPINEQKISNLFNKDVHVDLVILQQCGIIKIQKIDSNPKHDIITLNREIRIIESDY